MRSLASPIPETPLVKDSPAKRKRSLSDPVVIPFAPRLRTDCIDISSYEEERLLGASSPRTVVAERLSDLRLNGPLSVLQFNGLVSNAQPEDEQSHKKIKITSEDGVAMDAETEQDKSRIPLDEGTEELITVKPHERSLKSPPPSTKPNLEIEESPVQDDMPESQPDVDQASTLHPSASATHVSTTRKRSPSLPIRLSPTQPLLQEEISVIVPAPASKPSQPRKPLKRSAEDTNHEADDNVLDPDDDGTGINGIGFRPTPAEAWARAQRRKKQLSEWRVRENKEARERRSERRNRSAALLKTADVAMDGPLATRPRVRFAS